MLIMENVFQILENYWSNPTNILQSFKSPSAMKVLRISDSRLSIIIIDLSFDHGMIYFHRHYEFGAIQLFTFT